MYENKIGVKKYSLLQLSQDTLVWVKVEQGELSFFLYEKVVNQIYKAQINGCSLRIPSGLFASLVYYLLSGITFYSYYHKSLENSQTEPILVNDTWRKVRSVVSLDGDVIQQIRKDFLQDPNCAATTSAHYWFSDQLLSYFRTNLNLLAWQLALIFYVCLKPLVDIFLFAKANLILVLLELVVGLLLASLYRWLINLLQKHFYTNFKQLSWKVPLVLSWLASLFSIALTGLNNPINLKSLIQVVWSIGSPFLMVVFKRYLLPRISRWIIRWILSSNKLKRSIAKQAFRLFVV